MTRPQLSERFHHLDPSGMWGEIYYQPEQIEEANGIALNANLTSCPRPERVVITGMGGSASAGDLVAVLLKDSPVSIEVSRDYSLPATVGGNVLVVALSYSGNTEETLSAVEEAIRRGAEVVGIGSGGRLEETLRERGSQFLRIPGGHPPRAAIGYLAIPLLNLLVRRGLASLDFLGGIEATADYLRSIRDPLSRGDESSEAFRIAEKICRTIPVLYSSDTLTDMVAVRWRAQLAENAKILASHHRLPEMNHNEIVGWRNNRDLLGRTSILWLMDGDAHPRVRERQAMTRELLEGLPQVQLDIAVDRAAPLERAFGWIHLGDWVSFWVAMMLNTDPTPVQPIETLKQRLSGR